MTLRVLSWNVRTFGDPPSKPEALRQLVQIVLNSAADVVCVQEIQTGRGVDARIGEAVAPSVVAEVQKVVDGLRANDQGGGWNMRVSPINNSDQAKSMRDAYAFFWKATPAQSDFAHDDPLVSIEVLADPVILRQVGSDHFPGRRPGLVTLGLTAIEGAPPLPVNVVSWHAATPCNSIKKAGAVSSGRAIIELATLEEIGGFAYRSRNGGWSYQEEAINPLPTVDTLVLGDFNYSLDKSRALEAYANLLTSYEPCVSTEERVLTTTYSVNPQVPFSGVSSYDNIFVLPARDGFQPGLVFTGLDTSGVIDFIGEAAHALGEAAGIAEYPDETAWYVIFIDAYKRQYSRAGISDHMPVWADFAVSHDPTATAGVLPTASSAQNSLFHAAFGELIQGVFIDTEAAADRLTFATGLESLVGTDLQQATRDALLTAMSLCFQDDPQVTDGLEVLLANPQQDPFAEEGFDELFAAYVMGVRLGRPLLPQEAEVLAVLADTVIDLFWIEDGAYVHRTLNEGGSEGPVSIFHFGVHFFRFDPT